MNDDLKEALESLQAAMAFDSRDWSLSNQDAWLYGIIWGWNDEDGIWFKYEERPNGLRCLSEVGWDRLKQYNTAIKKAVGKDEHDKEGTDSSTGKYLQASD